MASRQQKPSVPSHPSLCLDDREHKVEDFYDDDECWACGLPLQSYWAWTLESFPAGGAEEAVTVERPRKELSVEKGFV